ncbi:MAG: T9SS type A sorting domain-containing protein [Candidatus Sabulitectum sp.]|nr:T9SS type A sorting domain-containing protein [Candidatus Sabulitectum sp.]
MIPLLNLLLSLPCFSTVIESEYPQLFSYSKETGSGYMTLGNLSSSWGGVPHLVTYTFDEYGMISSQTTASFPGALQNATDVQDGMVVVCSDSDNGVVRVAGIDETGSENWLTVFAGEFAENAVVRDSGSDILLAGNDAEALRIARLNYSGEVLWSIPYPEIDLSVCDISAYNGDIYVLCQVEQSSWDRGISILVLNETGGDPQLFAVGLPAWRYSPVSIEADPRGLFILANVMTEENNMIYESMLLKLNYFMEIQWAGSRNGTSWERGTDLLLLNEGFTVCGWTNSLSFSESNRSDLFVCNYDENGELLWDRTHGTSSTDYGLDVSQVSDGGFLFSGCVTEEFYKGWLLKTDSLGFLVPQGFENPANPSFSAVLTSNPLRSGALSFTVNCTESRMLEISIFDIAGRIVTETSSTVQSGESTVDIVHSLPPGIYSVRILLPTEDREICLRAVVPGGGK